MYCLDVVTGIKFLAFRLLKWHIALTSKLRYMKIVFYTIISKNLTIVDLSFYY